MLRAVGSLLRLGEQRLATAGAAYATQAQDYSLAMKTAAEVGKPSQSVGDKEASLLRLVLGLDLLFRAACLSLAPSSCTGYAKAQHDRRQLLVAPVGAAAARG